MLGPADSDEVLIVHRGILEAIEGKVQTVARGQRVFPYSQVTVTLVSPDADRRALYQTAFGEGGRLEADMREAFDAVDCEVPRGFHVDVKTAETGEKKFEIEYALEPAKAAAEEPPLGWRAWWWSRGGPRRRSTFSKRRASTSGASRS